MSEPVTENAEIQQVRQGCRLGIGLVCAVVTLVLDQISKNVLIEKWELSGRLIEITSYFNLVGVWNYGVSFGLFADDHDGRKWMLVLVALVITAVLLWMLWKQADRFLAIAYGLIIGGAIGNVIDRLRFGAVFDFLDVHVMGYHWPAFNVADSAIVIGVALLLYDSIIRAKHHSS